MIPGENKNTTTVSKSGKEGPANQPTCISLFFFFSYLALNQLMLSENRDFFFWVFTCTRTKPPTKIHEKRKVHVFEMNNSSESVGVGGWNVVCSFYSCISVLIVKLYNMYHLGLNCRFYYWKKNTWIFNMGSHGSFSRAVMYINFLFKFLCM